MEDMEKLMAHISKSFYKPDLQATRIILGTAFSHYFPRVDPIWLFVVGPPSSGKTAITIEALSGLTGLFGPGKAWGPHVKGSDKGEDDGPNTNENLKDQEAVELLSTINSNTFLSHMQGKDQAPGLLEQIVRGKPYKDKKTGKTRYTEAGHYEKNDTHKIVVGNILCLVPDFTVMASMRREMRGEIMGQLRRIFDGQFEKKIGTAITKIWKGKMTMIAATTPVIDKYTSIDASLGERFIQCNWRASRDRGRGVFTLERMMAKARGEQFKTPLKKMVRALFASSAAELLQLPGHPCLKRFSALAEITADARASVYGHQQDTSYFIDEVTVAEDIHRLIQEFFAQFSGIVRIHGREKPEEQDIQDVMRCGIETLPVYRSIVLQAGIEGKPLSHYEGSHESLVREAQKLGALGIIEKVLADSPVKLRKYWQEVIDCCELDVGSVFDAEGARAAQRKAAGATTQQAEIIAEFAEGDVI